MALGSGTIENDRARRVCLHALHGTTVHVFHERLWRISWDYDACVVRVSNIITSARGVRGGIFAPRHTGKDRETTAKGIHPREPERRRGEKKGRCFHDAFQICVVKRGFDKNNAKYFVTHESSTYITINNSHSTLLILFDVACGAGSGMG